MSHSYMESLPRACFIHALVLSLLAAGTLPASSQETSQLEQIVVTAQKREERLQDVPISDSVVTAAAAQERGITDTTSLQMAVPGLVVNHTANEGNFFIRGIGTNLYGPATEQTVAMYVDGVYMPSAEANMFSFNNIDRVEVLKGPQGTLFGRNTTGGAINFITKGPTDDFSIEEKTAYGSYNAFRTRTEVNTGLIGDTGLKALLAYSHHQNDGNVRNTLAPTSDGFGSLDSNSFYFALHGDLSDQLSFGYKIDYTDERDLPQAEFLSYVSPVDAAYFGASPKFGGAPLIVSPERLGTDSVLVTIRTLIVWPFDENGKIIGEESWSVAPTSMEKIPHDEVPENFKTYIRAKLTPAA